MQIVIAPVQRIAVITARVATRRAITSRVKEEMTAVITARVAQSLVAKNQANQLCMASLRISTT